MADYETGVSSSTVTLGSTNDIDIDKLADTVTLKQLSSMARAQGGKLEIKIDAPTGASDE